MRDWGLKALNSNGKDCKQHTPCCVGILQRLLRWSGFTLRLISFGFMCCSNSHAQIIADSSAPAAQQPSVIAAPNNVPVVNIQTPSAAGVSRNAYRQFDVQSNGAILNNSQNNVKTTLGEWIQGNAFLAHGTARVILNEVNSSTPSLLQGLVEIAGDRAQLVIANAAGISCDGCGFINANRTTLTTGVPIVNGGVLEGYRVQRGTVAINGQGLNDTDADFTEILARAVQVNAGLWAKELTVVSGAIEVDADLNPTAAVSGVGAAPAFGIDVAQLGGMYAGKITLLGTEAGLGVRNAGNIGASAGEVIITTDGQLENSGHITSNADLQLQTTADILNTGILYAQGHTTLNSAGNIESSGIIAAQGNTQLSAGSNGQIISSQTATLAAGAQADGSLVGNTGELILTAQTITAQGQNLSSGAQHYSAVDIDLAHSQTQGKDLTLDGSGNIDLTAATVLAENNFSAHAAQTVHSNQAHVSAAQLDITAHDLVNTQGELVQMGVGHSTFTVTGDLDNREGTLFATDSLTVSAANIINSGQIQASKNIDLQLSTLFNNSSGLIRAGDTVTIAAQTVLNNNTHNTDQGIEAATVHITANQLNNSAGAIRANTDFTFTGNGSIDNRGGVISSLNTLQLHDADLANKTLSITNTDGILIAGTQLDIDSKSISGVGRILSTGDLTVDVTDDLTVNKITDPSDATKIIDSIQADGDLTVSTQGTLTNQGGIAAGNTAQLNATALNNESTGEISATSTLLNITTLTNRGLIDGDNTTISAATVNNIGTGRIYGNHLAIAATTLTNDAEEDNAAIIAARERLDIGAHTINNREHSILFSVGDLFIGGGLDDNQQATGQADTLNNDSATIEALGNAFIYAHTLDNKNIHLLSVPEVLAEFTEEFVVSTGSSKEYPVSKCFSIVVGEKGSREVRCGEFKLVEDPDFGTYQPVWKTIEAKFTDYDWYQTETTTTKTQVLSSDPAQILTGSKLFIVSDTVVNRDSYIIAGNTIEASGAAVQNVATQGEQVATREGITRHSNSYKCGTFKTKNCRDWFAPAPYMPEPKVEETFDLPTVVYQSDTTPVGSGTSVHRYKYYPKHR